MSTWNEVGGIIKSVTGRRLIGIPTGPYEFGATELKIPTGSVEGAVHDLCHFVVASPEEKRMPNMGLSQDWTHPRWDRMVMCEELAWALEFWLYGNPTVADMASLMTPEACSSGGGGYITDYSIQSENLRKERREAARPVLGKQREAALSSAIAKGIRKAIVIPVQRAAIEELKRAKEVIYSGQMEQHFGENSPETLLALKLAEAMGFPLEELRKILNKEWDSEDGTP